MQEQDCFELVAKGEDFDWIDNPEDDACPDCGEARIDWLAWDDDGEYITCASCGCQYVP